MYSDNFESWCLKSSYFVRIVIWGWENQTKIPLECLPWSGDGSCWLSLRMWLQAPQAGWVLTDGRVQPSLCRRLAASGQVCVFTLQLMPGFRFGQKTQGQRGSASVLVSWEAEMVQNNLCTGLCLVLPLWLLVLHTAWSVSGTYFGREYIC